MKETNDGPFGLKRIVTDGGTTFFRNRDGIFDETGKKVMISMGELRRFECNERQRKEKTNLESEAASSDDAGSTDQTEPNTPTTKS